MEFPVRCFTCGSVIAQFYGQYKDGVKEKLIVYVRPIDRTGDAIKAAGGIGVQLWNLNAGPDEAMLAEWQVKPEEIKTLWSATMMTNYYRLTFDVGGVTSGEEELTVKVSFTDYTTGKVLGDQKVIQP